jgi:hypothetical protein
MWRRILDALFQCWEGSTGARLKNVMAIFRPSLKFGQAIVKVIFIKNSWIFLWTCGLVLASRRTNFYKTPIFGLIIMFQNAFFFLNMGS